MTISLKQLHATLPLIAGLVCLLSYGIVLAGPDSVAVKKNVAAASPASRKPGVSLVKQLVFEEQKIEGKIRRPQLVLIRADQRPDLGPMVMQSMGKSKNLAANIDRAIIEEAPIRGAFQFAGTGIINPAP